MPSRRGIFRSVTTMAGSQARAFSQPSMPSRAVSVRYPQPEISSASPIKRMGLVFDNQDLYALCILLSNTICSVYAWAPVRLFLRHNLSFYHATTPV